MPDPDHYQRHEFDTDLQPEHQSADERGGECGSYYRGRQFPAGYCTSGQPDQILGFLDSAATAATGSPYTQISYADPTTTLPSWLTYTSTGSTGSTPARNILVINVGAMVTALGSPPSQLYSIYVGSNPTTEPLSPATTSDPGIAITGANDLSAFANGLSIVSNQTLYLMDVFNQGATQNATSIFAPDVRYGISGTTPTSTTIVGQVSVDQASPSTQALPTPTPGSPLQFLDASGNKISTSTNKFTLSEINSALPLHLRSANASDHPVDPSIYDRKRPHELTNLAVLANCQN